MLEKPNLDETALIVCLEHAYGLHINQLTFLPLGADVNTVVYHTVVDGDTAYFVKLRRGAFDQTSVTLPRFLREYGITHIIAPLSSTTGQPWTAFDPFTVILYPFVQGQNGYRIALSESNWRAFGAALKQLHTAILPPDLLATLAQETYDPRWRAMVRQFLSQLDTDHFEDSVAQELAAFLKLKQIEILDLVQRAERFAQMLQADSPEFVVCHADIHAGNVLIDERGLFYIVDWDNPILAPKERDLMFIGGAQGFRGYTPEEEERLFYQGYGQTEINYTALAYYRYERIIQDIAAYCGQLLLTTEGGADREEALGYVKYNFLPGNTIERAYVADVSWKNRWSSDIADT